MKTLKTILVDIQVSRDIPEFSTYLQVLKVMVSTTFLEGVTRNIPDLHLKLPAPDTRVTGMDIRESLRGRRGVLETLDSLITLEKKKKKKLKPENN